MQTSSYESLSHSKWDCKCHIVFIPKVMHINISQIIIKDNDQRLWYAQKTIDNGWSRNLLETTIQSDLYGREGKAITNFKKTLPTPQSGAAQQPLKILVP